MNGEVFVDHTYRDDLIKEYVDEGDQGQPFGLHGSVVCAYLKIHDAWSGGLSKCVLIVASNDIMLCRCAL